MAGLLERHGSALAGWAAGEELLALEHVQFVVGGGGGGSGGGFGDGDDPMAKLAAAAGGRNVREAKAKGGRTMADAVPSRVGLLLMGVTRTRLGLWAATPQGPGPFAWETRTSALAGIEARPRRRLLARFDLRFTDGSAVQFTTARRGNVDRLGAAL